MIKRKLNILFTMTFTSFLLLFILATNSSTVKADSLLTQPLKIILEQNDFNSAQVIKEVLINNNVNYNAHPFLVDNIDYINSTIAIDNIDITKLGTQNAIATVSIKTINPLDEKFLFNKIITANVIIEVVDTTAPVIELTHDSVKLKYKQEFDSNKYIKTSTDNSGNEVVINQINDVDTSVPGDYVVTYTGLDSSMNKTTVDLAVKVLEKSSYINYGTDDSQINDMLNLINNYREQNGLSPYGLGSENAQTAIGVRACEAIGDVSHRRPDGRHYKTAFDEYNVSYNDPYEILTYSGSTVQSKFNWWTSSPGHNGALLDSQATKIAIGYCGSMWAAITYY